MNEESKLEDHHWSKVNSTGVESLQVRGEKLAKTIDENQRSLNQALGKPYSESKVIDEELAKYVASVDAMSDNVRELRSLLLGRENEPGDKD